MILSILLTIIATIICLVLLAALAIALPLIAIYVIFSAVAGVSSSVKNHRS